MTKPVPAVFSALIEQTLRRGGSPSVREISDSAGICNTIIACWSEVRSHAVTAGMSTTLAKAIEAMDAAVSAYEGE